MSGEHGARPSNLIKLEEADRAGKNDTRRRTTASTAKADIGLASFETLPAPTQSDAYEVGYGKPPVHSQFRPGHRGGPGRPKGSKNQATLFREAFDTPRHVQIEGRRKRLTVQDIAYRQLAAKCAKGDLKAIELSERIRDKHCEREQPAEVAAPPLTEAELAVLRRRNND